MTHTSYLPTCAGVWARIKLHGILPLHTQPFNRPYSLPPTFPRFPFQATLTSQWLPWNNRWCFPSLTTWVRRGNCWDGAGYIGDGEGGLQLVEWILWFKVSSCKRRVPSTGLFCQGFSTLIYIKTGILMDWYICGWEGLTKNLLTGQSIGPNMMKSNDDKPQTLYLGKMANCLNINTWLRRLGCFSWLWISAG